MMLVVSLIVPQCERGESEVGEPLWLADRSNTCEQDSGAVTQQNRDK